MSSSHLSILELNIPLDVHGGPAHVLVVHWKVHVRGPRRVPPLHVHAPVRVESRPHRVLLPEFPVPRETETAVPSYGRADHVLVVELLGDRDDLVFPRRRHLNQRVVRVVRDDHVGAVVVEVVPGVHRDPVPVVVEALLDLDEPHPGLGEAPELRRGPAEEAELYVRLLVLAGELEVEPRGALDVQLEAGREGVPGAEVVGGAAPYPAGEGGEVRRPR